MHSWVCIVIQKTNRNILVMHSNFFPLKEKYSRLSEIQGTKEKWNFVPLHSNIFVWKIGYKEMNVQKFRNFVTTEFVKSGIHCTCRWCHDIEIEGRALHPVCQWQKLTLADWCSCIPRWIGMRTEFQKGIDEKRQMRRRWEREGMKGKEMKSKGRRR